jgi:signal transduction histidine kinase
VIGAGVGQRSLSESLGRLRLRLTAWYVGTFFAILTLLGIGMFASITRRFDHDLDASLRRDAREVLRVARVRDSLSARSGAAAGALLDPVRDIRIPDRMLYVVDTLGAANGVSLDPWLERLALDAWHAHALDRTHRAGGDRILRAHAEALRLHDGRPIVAIAVADEIELEDRYASLIAAFGASALAAIVLVAVGGWLLARQSTAPVEEAVSHMRRFMADAAHELRTPLTVVRARAEVALQRARGADEYTQALHGIERESTRLGRIVEDLLLLARADAGERPIERRRVFLDDVTLDAAEAARVIAERKRVRLEVADFEEAAVSGDADLLRQLVMILLDNAIKFTAPNGVVRVQVLWRGSTVVLTVADEGVGIPADQLPHVFERFYRGDPSRTRGSGAPGDVSAGAGLGLSIAHIIAAEHAATIAIESEPGQGTRVAVQFPALNADGVSSS